MYKKQKPSKTTLLVNKSYQGEAIEIKIARILNNKEPIRDGAQVIYTERKDGVQPQYDIRHDKFETAIELSDKVSKSHSSLRNERLAEEAKKNMEKEKITETKNEVGDQPTQTTESK